MGLIKKIGGICNCYSLHCVTEAAYDNTDVFYIIMTLGQVWTHMHSLHMTCTCINPRIKPVAWRNSLSAVI